MLGDGLAVVRIVGGVCGDDLSVLRDGRVDFLDESVLVVDHTAPVSRVAFLFLLSTIPQRLPPMV
jgi:hypothetical protein